MKTKKTVDIDEKDLSDLQKLPRFRGVSFSNTVRTLIKEALTANPYETSQVAPDGFKGIIHDVVSYPADEFMRKSQTFSLMLRHFGHWIALYNHAAVMRERIRRELPTRVFVFCVDDFEVEGLSRSVTKLLSMVPNEIISNAHQAGHISISYAVEPNITRYNPNADNHFVMLFDRWVIFNQTGHIPYSHGYFYAVPPTGAMNLVEIHHTMMEAYFSITPPPGAEPKRDAIQEYLDRCNVPPKALL